MRPTLTRLLPLLGSLSGYDRVRFSSDLLAAVIVTVMLIPQSLAYALLAGRLRQHITRPRTLAWLRRCGGGVLIAMAAFTATLRRV